MEEILDEIKKMLKTTEKCEITIRKPLNGRVTVEKTESKGFDLKKEKK